MSSNHESNTIQAAIRSIANVHESNIEELDNRHALVAEKIGRVLNGYKVSPFLDEEQLANYWQWSDSVITMADEQCLAMILLTVFMISKGLREKTDQKISGRFLMNIRPSKDIFGKDMKGNYDFELSLNLMREHKAALLDLEEELATEGKFIGVRVWAVKNTFSSYWPEQNRALTSVFSTNLENAGIDLKEKRDAGFFVSLDPRKIAPEFLKKG